MADYIVKADQFINVRATPSTAEMPIAQVNTGQTVHVVDMVDSQDPKYPGQWARVLVTAGGAPSRMIGYMWAPLLAAVGVTPAPEPTPTTTTRTIMGTNVITNGADADALAASGALYAAITFNDGLAVRIKQQHPEMHVTHRAMFYGGHLPSWQEFQEKHGYALAKNSPVELLGCNEEEQVSSGSPAGIKARADWDWDKFQRCRDMGVSYVAGGWSMGVPDIMRKDIRDAMRDAYLPYIQQGMKRFNQHLYSGRTNEPNPPPIEQRIYREALTPFTMDGMTVMIRPTWWLEERVRWYTTFCGWPAWVEFITDEMGWDEDGGFSSHKATDQIVVAHNRQFIKLHSQPTIVNGKEQEHHLTHAAYFQAGDDARWAGFEMRGYFGALGADRWGR